jgi:hypothetical protein
MEKGPEPQPRTAIAATAPQTAAGTDADTPPAAQPAAGAAAPQTDEPMKRCPMCAETIKAAARKCRFCGTILDEELRAEEAAPGERRAIAAVLADAEQSTHTWRVLAMVATVATVCWLSLLTTATYQKSPQTLVLFNVLLIVALVWNSRQMHRGPASVFLAAGLAIVLCMPLDALLGLTLFDAEYLKEMQKLPQDQEWASRVSVDQLNRVMCLLFAPVGFVVSIPIWIAMLKVTYLQRLRRAMAPRNGLEGRR